MWRWWTGTQTKMWDRQVLSYWTELFPNPSSTAITNENSDVKTAPFWMLMYSLFFINGLWYHGTAIDFIEPRDFCDCKFDLKEKPRFWLAHNLYNEGVPSEMASLPSSDVWIHRWCRSICWRCLSFILHVCWFFIISRKLRTICGYRITLSMNYRFGWDLNVKQKQLWGTK